MIAAAINAMAASADAQPPDRRAPPPSDDGAWHALPVPGGTFALESLGIPPTTPRSLVLTELVRRLVFDNLQVTKLEAAVAELSASLDSLRHLLNAIALGSSPGKPMTVASARQRSARNRLRDALEAAGLELREVKREFIVQNRDGSDNAQLRARLKSLGVDVEALRQRLMRGEGLTIDVPTVTLPLPLSRHTWNRAVFARDVPASQMFITILTDPAARLLYHGLMAVDGDTRRWLGSQDDLINDLYGDTNAVRAFALFGSALRVSGGQPVVPGGRIGARHWSALLDTDITRADRFVQRLFTREAGRLAGLYFALANADPPHQALILGEAHASQDSFLRLASRFAACYGSELIAYPFGQRSHDPTALLLEIEVTASGAIAAPPWRRFWTRAMDGTTLPDDPRRDLRHLEDDGTVDAAWLVDAICNATSDDRETTFETLLFAGRVFAGADTDALPDVLVAVRARRVYPGLIMAIEQAGLRNPRTYAALARAAEQVSREGDPAKAVILLQQFQGAVALTLAAIKAHTLNAHTGGLLLESLAAVPVREGRYDGRMANWFAHEWLPAVTGPTAPRSDSAESHVARALAGAPTELSAISWEGRSYELDFAGTAYRQLLGARARQGGEPLDTAIALSHIVMALRSADVTMERVKTLRSDLAALARRLENVEAAEELGEDAPNVTDRVADSLSDLSRIDSPRRLDRTVDAANRLSPVLDFVFGAIVASWVYAPFIGSDEVTRIVGDPSRRHEFGLRLSDRFKNVRRWEPGWRNNMAGRVSGALVGLDVALAPRALKRLSTDRVPSEPVVTGNDLIAYQWTVALSDPRQLTNEARDRIATALSAGAAVVAAAAGDVTALNAAAEKAAISPWRRQVLSWTATEEPERLAVWFGPADLAAIGGLAAESLHAWGTAYIASGCVCLRMPPRRIPEVLIGRPTAGLLPHLSTDLIIRIAAFLKERDLPAPLAQAVLPYAMREFVDRVSPAHSADFTATVEAATALDASRIEDYVGAIAAVGPLRTADQSKKP
jgi:hypothetical protein